MARTPPAPSVAELMARPYKKVVVGTPDDGYVAEAPELDRCLGLGETEEEALEGLRQAMESWFEAAIGEGHPIPEAGDAQRDRGQREPPTPSPEIAARGGSTTRRARRGEPQHLPSVGFRSSDRHALAARQEERGLSTLRSDG